MRLAGAVKSRASLAFARVRLRRGAHAHRRGWLSAPHPRHPKAHRRARCAAVADRWTPWCSSRAVTTDRNASWSGCRAMAAGRRFALPSIAIVSMALANLAIGVSRLGSVWSLGRELLARRCRGKTLSQKSDDERVLGHAFRLGAAREERVHVAGQPDAELAARKRWIPRSRGRRQGPTLGSVRLDRHA